MSRSEAMDQHQKGTMLNWPSAIATAVAFFIVTLAVHRLYLHPLSRFPGPKLAAITRLYEAYYDVVQNGQYTFEIAKMHKRYGELIPPSSTPVLTLC